MLLGGDVTVNSDSPSLMLNDLRGFTNKGEAVYSTPRAAARSLYLFCLLDMPHVRGLVHHSEGVPHWLTKHCGKAKEGQAVFFYVTDAVGLMGDNYYGTFNKHRLFGALTFRIGHGYEFYVPHDDNPYSQTQDRDDWECFNIQPPPFIALAKCPLDRCMSLPRTLVGKTFCVQHAPMIRMAKIFHFGPVTNEGNENAEDEIAKKKPNMCYYHAKVDGMETQLFDCAMVLKGCGYPLK
jgi:hypothetical protein